MEFLFSRVRTVIVSENYLFPCPRQDTGRGQRLLLTFSTLTLSMCDLAPGASSTSSVPRAPTTRISHMRVHFSRVVPSPCCEHPDHDRRTEGLCMDLNQNASLTNISIFIFNKYLYIDKYVYVCL